MLLRNVHTHITETHGLPYWGSYLLFAFTTILIGAVLGLFLVFVIDCFYPTKIPAKQNIQQTIQTNEEQVRKQSIYLTYDLDIFMAIKN